MSKEIFRHDTIEKLASTAQMSKLLVVIRLRGWLTLVVLALLIIGILVWSILGQIPIITTGKGVLLAPHSQFPINSPQEGIVQEIFIQPQQNVAPGTPLMKLSTGAIITASKEGKVFQMGASEGESVKPGEVLMWFESKIYPSDLQVYGFVSTAVGERIKQGMPVTIDLGAIDTQKYGQLVGEVSEVAAYPVSATSDQLKVIPSEKLREQLTQGTTAELVIIQLTLNPDNPSGLSWTFGKGPDTKLSPGSMGTVRVTIENKRPVSYLVPMRS